MIDIFQICSTDVRWCYFTEWVKWAIRVAYWILHWTVRRSVHWLQSFQKFSSLTAIISALTHHTVKMCVSLESLFLNEEPVWHPSLAKINIIFIKTSASIQILYLLPFTNYFVLVPVVYCNCGVPNFCTIIWNILWQIQKKALIVSSCLHSGAP